MLTSRGRRAGPTAFSLQTTLLLPRPSDPVVLLFKTKFMLRKKQTQPSQGLC